MNNSYNGSETKMAVVAVTPKTFDDVESAITLMQDKKSVICYTQSLSGSFAQRVMDYISGAAFALGAELFEVSPGVYMIIPENVTIVNNN